jgi:hypothetical protein
LTRLPAPCARLRAGDESAAAAAAVPEQLELLKGISGYACPGQLTALMGGSGGRVLLAGA